MHGSSKAKLGRVVSGPVRQDFARYGVAWHKQGGTRLDAMWWCTARHGKTRLYKQGRETKFVHGQERRLYRMACDGPMQTRAEVQMWRLLEMQAGGVQDQI
jgi:hypothetical protein